MVMFDNIGFKFLPHVMGTQVVNKEMAREHFELGRKYYESGNFENAIREF